MSSILVLAAQDSGVLLPETARTLTAALALGGEVHVLVAGKECRQAAMEAACLEGVGKVLLAEYEVLEGQRAEIMQALVIPLMSSYTALLAPATTTGRNIVPRIAAALDVMQISDIIAIHPDGSFDRPFYAGNAVQTVRSRDKILVATIRVTAFVPAGKQGEPAPVETLPEPRDAGMSVFVGRSIASADRPDLSSARRVVAGGRGLASEENFTGHILPLADILGAAVGASRAAVDAGYASNDCQIGQTGRIIAPELYIAIGISGAIQHVAGIKDAAVIVAINADEESPIFEIADFGLVGDLFTLTPELIKSLQ